MHIKDTFPALYKIRQVRRKPLEMEDVRQRLGAVRGKEYWRSLDELADSEEFAELLHREFPQAASEMEEGTDRRTFIKLMGASLALAGVSGCTYQPPETIIPYVREPEGLVPGKPLFFATAMPMGGAGVGLLVRSNMGRPTKIEGNELHPASLGATDIFSQASILTLYDPDRSQTHINRGEIGNFTSFLAEMSRALEAQTGRQGAGLRFLTETISSPTAAAQMQEIAQRFPAAKWHQYEPAGSNAGVGARLAFGEPVNTIYNFAEADRVLSLDADFLSCGPASLRYARDFAGRRRLAEGKTEMNRLYVVETTATQTGMVADHRLAIRPSEMEGFARALAAALGAPGAAAGDGAHAEWIAAVARDLQSVRGRSIVIAGDEQTPVVHALAHAINGALGNVGTTVTYTEPVEANPVDQLQSLRELIADIDNGLVELLVIVEGNPVYNTPADLKLDKARLDKVPLRVHLGLYQDETADLCQWHINEAHYLEAWSDTRAFDGTATIIQPLIAPLYDGKSIHELLAAFTNTPERSGYSAVREFWQNEIPTTEFDKMWRRIVHDGVIPNTQRATKSVTARNDFATQGPGAGEQGSAGNQLPGATTVPQTSTSVSQPPTPGPQPPAPGLEIVFRPDPTVYDGRFANNGWLQELPKPITKLTWDTVAMVSPATAARLGLDNENTITSKGSELMVEVVRLRFKGREVTAPLWVQPGQPDGVVTLHLGYGRWRAGRVGTSIPGEGARYPEIPGPTEDPGKPEGMPHFQDAYQIRTSDALWSGVGVEVVKTGVRYQLASTQLHFNIEDDREIVRAGTLEQYRQNPTLKPHRDEDKQPPKPAGENREPAGEGESMYPDFDYSDSPERMAAGFYPYRWGMSIDINSCVGCSACVVACQAENNIPIVGKDQVARGREMHWLRVDAYFRGGIEKLQGVYFMPVPCMHCENAPCEPVCPVHATVHDTEGLNLMVYNRCVGTRYCSNNCPYKVRRFNFFLYQDWNTPSLKMQRNPEVTVRSRGVMEKCTYCIQRIEYAKIESEKEGRRVRDGEVVTACQAACPTEAIIFGDLNDPESRVAKLHREPRQYSLLADLNTRPRTTYLAAVRNPNPEIR